LYAANNAGTGSIDVFNSSFTPMSLGAGAFATPAAMSALGLDPFNVRDINGSVYVTYALPGNAQDTAALGEGAVAVFNESGTLEQTVPCWVRSRNDCVALKPARRLRTFCASPQGRRMRGDFCLLPREREILVRNPSVTLTGHVVHPQQ
jgi:hypothetical protein